MYKHTNKKDEKEFKYRKEAISKYWILASFSFDSILDNFQEGEEIFDNTYFLEKSRLYKKKDDNKYYSFTSLFLSIVKEEKRKGTKKIYIEPIIDMIIKMNKDKVISQRMTFIKIKNEDYQDILIDYIDQNNTQNYNISSISAEELNNIISNDDYLLRHIIRHNGTKTRYKQPKIKDFINMYLEHYKN